VGLQQQERQFCRYHRVLSRASWSSREAGCVLLGLLVEAFVPDGPLVLGIDETLERRRGKKISARVGSTATLGSLQPRPFREGERFTLGMSDVAGPDAVGFSGLGLALSLSIGLLRALRQRTGQAAQETDRVGVATASVSEALVPRARDSGRRR
jgi:DDE superfamily endonuclease